MSYLDCDVGAVTIKVSVNAPALADPDHQGNLGSHPFVGEYRTWTLEHARACKLALDAGVEERQVLHRRTASAARRDRRSGRDRRSRPHPRTERARPEVIANLLRAIAAGDAPSDS